VAGMFYWMESVQSYDEGGWKYMEELANFVEGGMQGTSFIDAVSGIVNRGCHDPPCGTGAVDGSYERSQNFQKVLAIFFDPSLPEILSPLDESLSLVESLGCPQYHLNDWIQSISQYLWLAFCLV